MVEIIIIVLLFKRYKFYKQSHFIDVEEEIIFGEIYQSSELDDDHFSLLPIRHMQVLRCLVYVFIIIVFVFLFYSLIYIIN